LTLAACFDGAGAAGWPCENDAQCGPRHRCEQNFCGGPPGTTADATGTSMGPDTMTTPSTGVDPSTSTAETTADASSSGTDTGDVPLCPPPPDVSRCSGAASPALREATWTEYADPGLGNVTAIVAAELTGEGNIDLAVLSFSPFELRVLRNTGNWSWEVLDTFTDLDMPYDVIATDLDCDGEIEFIVTGAGGTVVIPWNGDSFGGEQPLATQQGNFSLAAGDLVVDDEGYPDLVLASNTAVQLVPNVGGMLDANRIDAYQADFSEPWDMLVLGAGADARVLVVESDDEAIMLPSQRVAILQVSSGAMPEIGVAEPAVLAGNFQNPWAIAAGDFSGTGEVRIAVAERNLTGPGEVSDVYGQLRFFGGPPDYEETLGGGVSVGAAPGALATADLDCDGVHDVVVGYGGASGVDEGGVNIVFGTDPIDVGNEPLLVDFLGTSDGVGVGTRMAVGDFDGDGRPEIAVPDFGAMGTAGARVVFVDLEEP